MDVVTVRVPATSANLGPGFDAFGLALGLYDEVTVETQHDGVTVEVRGEGEAFVARDERNLVHRALMHGFAAWGVEPRGVRLSCRNAVPHSRGLGSSAAAVVTGLLAARALGGLEPRPEAVLPVASELEGHPDNVAACLYGGVTVAWLRGEGAVGVARLHPAPGLTVVAYVPEQGLSTKAARRLLPASVPHADAAFTAGRAGLLTVALTERPDLLLDATEDRLHQTYRYPAMPASAALVERLRRRGVPAVISGAGPTVLALHASGRVDHDVAAPGFRQLPLVVDSVGASCEAGR